MLTDKAIKAAAAKDKPYKITDGNGLYLYVTTKGHKTFRFKYRFEKKEQLLTFGKYPELSLADAREKRDWLQGSLPSPVSVLVWSGIWNGLIYQASIGVILAPIMLKPFGRFQQVN